MYIKIYFIYTNIGDTMKNISINDIKEFKKKYISNKKNKIIENAITNNGINEVALNRCILNENRMVFSIELPEGKIVDQKNSGRCWCFAGLNLLKYNISKNMNIDIDKFNLSASYLTFYDKLEKMNTILEEILSLKKIDYDTIHNLNIMDYDEGGYFESFKELVKKYGVIPTNYMKENTITENSDIANLIIDEKIKRDICTLINTKNKSKRENITKKLMSDNYTLLSKIFGEVPTKIKLEYKDKNNNLISKTLTPLEYYNEYCSIDLDDYVGIASIDMYNKSYYRKYKRKYGETVFNRSKEEFINLPKEELKELVIASLKDNQPVWFSCEINEMCSREYGILDTRIYNYEDIFNFKQLTTSEGLNLHYYGSSHAMSIVGVYIEKNKPIRWKVENSWGNNVNDGYLIMNDNYFDKFVMEVIINKKYLNEKQLEVLKKKPITMRYDDPV